MAPAFAIPADKPAPLARIAVGNTSPERRNVVELGPAFMEKLNRKNPAKIKIKLGISTRLLLPEMANKYRPIAIPKKPIICRVNLPILSTNKIAIKKPIIRKISTIAEP